MDKIEVLATLHAAKVAHLQWRARAQALVAGIPIDQDHVPVLYTDCKFGKWYYGEGQKLRALPTFGALEDPHQQLHLVYMEMFKYLFGEGKRSAWSRLFGSKTAHRERELAAAEALLPRLIGISQTLLETIDILEKEIIYASDEEFHKIQLRVVG